MTALRAAAKGTFAAADMLHRTPNGPRVLIYHQVGAGLGRQMEVSYDDFVWQLDWLADNRDVTSLGDAIARWDHDDAEQMVVITFDDGYQDTHRVAFPALAERKLPFTIYLCTSHMETREGRPGAEPLRWDEVSQMMESGLVTLGSHTHTHPDLRTASADQVERELSTSDGLMISKLGVAPRHFAYPWGYWSEVADPYVRARYDSAALGSRHHAINPTDPHLLHRVPVQLSDRRVWFKRRLAGGLLLEERVRRRLRGYTGP